jgi:hypothetical protein
LLYWVVKGVLTPIMRVCFRMKVEGRENLPKRGPVILASNHRSFLDSIFIPAVLRRRVTFVAKAEYFDDPKTAWFFRGLGQIPIRREGGSASERALASASAVLQGADWLPQWATPTKGWAISRLPTPLVQEIVPGWWPRAFVLALVGSLLGALYPGLKAANQDVIESLGHVVVPSSHRLKRQSTCSR